MNYTKKLLNGQKVEWKTLGEVCSVLRGKRLTKKELVENGEYPVFHGGLIPLGRYNEFNRKANQTMVINTGSVGEVVWSDVDFWSSDGTFVVQTNEEVDDKYLYHFLKTKENDFKNQKREGGVPTIERGVIERVSLPLPPLSVQKEIANILDKFTTLEAELEAELDCRKKQYTYYRDKLLTFGDNVEWKTLGEVVPLQRGRRLVKNQLSENAKYKVFQNSLQPLGYFTESNCRAYMTFIISAGAAGEIGFSNEEFWACDDCYYFDCPKDLLDDKFLYYFLKSQQHQLTSQVRKASVPRLGRVSIENLKIPLPPLSEQERIAGILDSFDKLVNDISEGLPAEIIARRKQYEYYREKLLAFDE